MSAVQPSPNLRDFLCIKDDDAAAAAAAAGPHFSSVSPSRTLLDIIRDDSNATEKGKDPGSWTSLKDLLGTEPPLSSEIRGDSPSPETREEYSVTSAEGLIRHGNDQERRTSSPGAGGRRRGSTRFGTLVPISIEPAIPTQSPVTAERIILGDQLAIPPARGEPPRESIRRLSVVLAEERQQSVREAEAARETSPTDHQPVRMSLMDLLEETNRSIGLEGMRNAVEDDVDVGGGVGDIAGVDQKCCICMVRHKGAAFIPCGHTFCRLCSRELWVARGHCPLCNHYIVEILDIF